MLRFLLLLLVLTVNVSFAQNFSVSTNDTTFYGEADGYGFGGEIDLINNTNDTLSMRWAHFENNAPSGWTFSFCDPQLCYGEGTDSANFFLPVQSALNYISTHIAPNGEAGSGYCKVRVWELGNPSEAQVLTYNGVASASGIKEVEVLEFSIYPNPVEAQLNIAFKDHSYDDIQVEVFDALGRNILAGQINAGVRLWQMDTRDLKPGVYYLKVSMDENQIVHRFVR